MSFDPDLIHAGDAFIKLGSEHLVYLEDAWPRRTDGEPLKVALLSHGTVRFAAFYAMHRSTWISLGCELMVGE